MYICFKALRQGGTAKMPEGIFQGETKNNDSITNFYK